MRRLLLTLLGYLILCPCAPAQNEALNWVFGEDVSITFTAAGPVLNPPLPVRAIEGVTAISDAAGQLLFYSNGGPAPAVLSPAPGSIRAADGRVIHDMMGVQGGGASARQSSIIVPRDGETYYLFTVDERESLPDSRGLRYFVVSVGGAAGEGEILAQDVAVSTPAFEGLDATPRPDGGHWIATQSGLIDNSLVIALATADSVGDVRRIELERPVAGIVRFSPNGEYLYNNGTVYAFDRFGGEVTGIVLELPAVDRQSVSFTDDSRFLYFRDDSNPAVGSVIGRLDLTNGNRLDAGLLGSATAASLVTSTLQIGPDGNLYFLEVALDGSRRVLSRVTCPSTREPAVTRAVLDLADRDVSFLPANLPNFVDALFRRPFAGDDPMRVIVDNNVCANSDPTVSARLLGRYLWSTGDTTRRISVPESGVYSVTVSGECLPTVETYRVDLVDDPVAEIVLRAGNERCPDQLLDLSVRANLAVDSVRWSTGDTTTTISLVPGAGATISAEVFTECGSATALFATPIIDTPPAPTLSATDALLCPGEETELTIDFTEDEEPTTIEWFDGSDALTRTVEADSNGRVFVELTDPCGEVVRLTPNWSFAESCACRAAVPEVFTPNRDGTNDGFGLFTDCNLDALTIVVFNRWGQAVWRGTDPGARWDGNNESGRPAPPDVYYYSMSFRYRDRTEAEQRQGQVTLVR